MIFLSATLLIAIAKPYKESYMNVFDTILLGQLTFMSKMHTSDYYDGMGTQIFLVNLIPAIALVVCLLYAKVIKVYKFRCCRRCVKNSQTEDDLVNSLLESNVRDRSETQPLLNSTSSTRNYSDEF